MSLKNAILAKISAIILFLTIALFPSIAFASDKLRIQVHLNDFSGSMWTDEKNQIKIKVPSVGIGISEAGIDPTHGGLYIKESKECKFDADDDLSNGYETTILLESFDQLIRGEFLVPPTRFRAEKIVEHGSLDHTTLDNNCSPDGTYAQYQAFTTVFNGLDDSPFKDYSEILQIPTNASVDVSIEHDLASGKIKNLDGDEIKGVSCKSTIVKQGVSKDIEGICSANARLNETTKLVILYDEKSPLGYDIQASLQAGNDAEFSEVVTFVGNFAIRTHSLLNWSLGIDETGFRNPKIELIFNKFLNIVNGFFILSLVVIAFLWNFSALLPKSTLKKLLALFMFGVLSVNFALPISRALVDGTNILQRTLLVKSGSESEVEKDTKNEPITASDIMVTPDVDYGGFVGLQKGMYVEKSYPASDVTKSDKFTSRNDIYMDRYKERTFFNLTLITLGSVGQLLIALIIVFRYVILWFLLIFSPFIFVLFIFKTTRYVFNYWIWLYFRWLFIGPILAMSLYIIVNIWSLTGVPIESSFTAPSALIFPNTTNLNVAAPGVLSGYLNTPREVMKYITALMMLYMSIILPFWLTRVKPPSGVGAKDEEKKPFLSAIQKFWKKDSSPKMDGGHSMPTHSELSHMPTDLSSYKQLKISPPEKDDQKEGLSKPVYNLLLHSDKEERPVYPKEEAKGTPSEKTTNTEKESVKDHFESDKSEIKSDATSSEKMTTISNSKTQESKFSNTRTKDLVDRLKILNASIGWQSSNKRTDVVRDTEKKLVQEELSQRARFGDKEAGKELEKISQIEQQKNIKEVSDNQMKSEQNLQEFLKSKRNESTSENRIEKILSERSELKNAKTDELAEHLNELSKQNDDAAYNKIYGEIAERAEAGDIQAQNTLSISAKANLAQENDVSKTTESSVTRVSELSKQELSSSNVQNQKSVESEISKTTESNVAKQSELSKQESTSANVQNQKSVESEGGIKDYLASKKEKTSDEKELSKILENENELTSSKTENLIKNLGSIDQISKEKNVSHEKEKNIILKELERRSDDGDKKAEQILSKELDKIASKSPISTEVAEEIKEGFHDKKKFESKKDILNNKAKVKQEYNTKSEIPASEKPINAKVADSKANLDKNNLDESDKILENLISGKSKVSINKNTNEDISNDEEMIVDKKKQKTKLQMNQQAKTWDEDLKEEDKGEKTQTDFTFKTTAGHASGSREQAVEDGVVADWSKKNVTEKIIQEKASTESGNTNNNYYYENSKASNLNSISEQNSKDKKSSQPKDINNQESKAEKNDKNIETEATKSTGQDISEKNSDEDEEDEILKKIQSINSEEKSDKHTFKKDSKEKSIDDLLIESSEEKKGNRQLSSNNQQSEIDNIEDNFEEDSYQNRRKKTKTNSGKQLQSFNQEESSEIKEDTIQKNEKSITENNQKDLDEEDEEDEVLKKIRLINEEDEKNMAIAEKKEREWQELQESEDEISNNVDDDPIDQLLGEDNEDLEENKKTFNDDADITNDNFDNNNPKT